MQHSKARSKLSSKVKEKNSILKWLVALLLVSLCLIAANWQYQRGVDRHAKNFKIEANTKLATIPLSEVKDFNANEWRTVTASGVFDTTHEVLLRNHYSDDGVYGFEYLTLFKSHGKNFWVDRGWVKAGASASARPEMPSTPSGEVKITGRIRLNSALPHGSFFAIPSSGNLVSAWNLRAKVKTESYYIDLISGDSVTPQAPAELPELSDGPHMAYALQWLFFAGLILYGRFLIRR
jgi:surfeit locus 1 family protein